VCLHTQGEVRHFWCVEIRYLFLVNLMQKLLKSVNICKRSVNICKSCCKKCTAMYFMAHSVYMPCPNFKFTNGIVTHNSLQQGLPLKQCGSHHCGTWKLLHWFSFHCGAILCFVWSQRGSNAIDMKLLDWCQPHSVCWVCIITGSSWLVVKISTVSTLHQAYSTSV